MMAVLLDFTQMVLWFLPKYISVCFDHYQTTYFIMQALSWNTATSYFQIGSNNIGGGQYWRGDLFDIVGWNIVLTDQQGKEIRKCETKL